MKPGNNMHTFSLTFNSWMGRHQTSVPFEFRKESLRFVDHKKRRKQLDELNKLFLKGKLSKSQWQEYRLMARLGLPYQLEVVDAIIKVLNL